MRGYAATQPPPQYYYLAAMLKIRFRLKKIYISLTVQQNKTMVPSSSTVFTTTASFNSVVVEPHFKCGYTIKESSLLLLTYYYTSTVYVLLVCAMVL